MSQADYERQVQETQLGTLWEIPDAMWERIEPLLPEEKVPGTPGRPPVPFRTVLNGILHVLRTGCQWNKVPQKYSSGSTLHRRFQEWEAAGILDAILEMMLAWYDERQGIDWAWQSADTKLVPAPLGGEKTGPNPTDLAKSGSKRHLLIDGRGVPLAFHLSAANRHDKKGLASLLGSGLLTERPEPTEQHPQHLCLDKGYDYDDVHEHVEALGYISHIKRQGETDDTPGLGEPVHPPRRWKVERSISWLNNMRKLRTRWAKKAANYRGLWLLASALCIFRRIVLG